VLALVPLGLESLAMAEIKHGRRRVLDPVHVHLPSIGADDRSPDSALRIEAEHLGVVFRP
jgi:hypothetical protein